MLVAVITGIFGLIPFVVAYLAGRERELSLIERELKILKQIPKDSANRDLFEQHVAWSITTYVLRDEMPENQRKKRVRWGVAWALTYPVMLGLTLVMLVQAKPLDGLSGDQLLQHPSDLYLVLGLIALGLLLGCFNLYAANKFYPFKGIWSGSARSGQASSPARQAANQIRTAPTAD